MASPALQQTPRCRNVLAEAERLATELGHGYVGVEHLFLAMLQDRGAVPTQVLATRCALDSVAQSLRELMASDSYRGQPPADAVWVPRSELSDLLRVLPEYLDPAAQVGFNVAGDRAWITVIGPGDAAAAVAAARARLAGE